MKNLSGKNMLKVTICDDFLKLEMSGEFESVDEAKEFYANELGTFPECIDVVKVERK